MSNVRYVYQPIAVEAIRVTDCNYASVCEFIVGHHPTKAESPTMARGKYFGIFVWTRHERQLARIGEYIVKIGETAYQVYSEEEFNRTFKILEK